MSKKLADLLDLSTAWKRVKADSNYYKTNPLYNFIRNDFEFNLIESNLDEWLNLLYTDISCGKFSPDKAEIFEFHKKGETMRKGSFLSLKDQIIYDACVNACFPHIYKALTLNPEIMNDSLILSTKANSTEWGFNKSSKSYFTDKGLLLLKKDISHVVFTDIYQYCRSVNINILGNKLRDIGSPAEVVDLLVKCLDKWTQIPGKSFPLGNYSVSFILGEFYLNPIDIKLKENGYTFVRSMDDYMFFCKSYGEAQNVLNHLIQLLIPYDMKINTEKTSIHSPNEAKKKIKSIIPKNSVIKKLVKFLFSSKIPMKTSFIRLNSWLINKCCKNYINNNPKKAYKLIKYFGYSDIINVIQDTIINSIRPFSKNYIYYIYLIMDFFNKWLDKKENKPFSKLIEFAHELLSDKSLPSYVHSMCINIIKNHDLHNFKQIKNTYIQIKEPLKNEQIIY